MAGFLFIRLSVFLAGAAETEFAQAAKMGDMPGVDFHIGRNIILFGYHIHHFYIGFALIAVAGWLALVGSDAISKKYLAAMYGTGLGLFFDEIGLLLTWGDYYSQLSYLLTIFLAGIFLNIVFFHDFWLSVRDNVVQSKTQSFFWRSVMSHKTFLNFADFVSNTSGKTEKTGLIFTGLLYIFVAVIVFFYPQTLRYWISLVFFIQGIEYLAIFVLYKRDGNNDQ
jgi:hypothetical protein